MAHGQYVQSCGTPSPLSRPSGQGALEVVPSMCVSERYDSNVFYLPPTPGVQRADFVTTVNAGLGVNHNGSYATGALNAGGFYETYIRNPGLNYVGMNGNLALNLDKSIRRLFPNASLNVFDNVRYTPLPPGFVNAEAGKSPADPSNIQSVYAQGIMGFRSNNLVNNGTVSASYATTASTSLNASYTYGMIRFGSNPSTQGQTLFDSTSQIGTVGGAAQLTELDSMNIKYAHMQTESTPSSPSASSQPSTFIKVDSATIGWSRTLTPGVNASLGGGGILISPSQTLTYAANAALTIKSLNNSATLSYAHSAFPSFYGGGGVVIGDVFSLGASQAIDQQWQLSQSASYAHTSNENNLNPTSYDSFVLGGDIQYWMTSIWSTALSYQYSKFSNQSGSVTTDVYRQIIELSIKATWG